MKYFVYILKSKNHNKTYVGYTNNLERRLKEHNSGKSIFTSKFVPWEIIYKEEFDQEIEARKKEKYYKSSAGRRKIKLLISK
jgi:putative endonuclease